MADLTLGKQKNYQSTKTAEPVKIEVGAATWELNVTETAEAPAALGIKVTFDGVETFYEVALTERV